MAYGRIDNQTSTHGSWVEEQTAFIKEAGTDRSTLNFGDKFFEEFDNVVDTIKATHDIDIRKDAQRMMNNKAVMEQYKDLLLQPILTEFREKLVNETEDEGMKQHLIECADNLEAAWDTAQGSFIKESYNVANYLPLSTLDFPALVKQYIRFIGKEIIPVQTASSFNIEQRIMNKYLVNNQTGEEYEVPKVYFQREPDGTRTWRKLWNAGKGLRINDKTALPLATIQAATNKKYSIFKWLLDDAGNPLDFTSQVTPRTRMSYDFHINYVEIAGAEASTSYDLLAEKPADWDTATGVSTKYFTRTGSEEPYTYNAVDFTSTAGTVTFTADTYYEKKDTPAGDPKKVRLPGSGINVDIQTGGVFLNGGLTKEMNLAVVDPATNKPTGEVVNIEDHLSGVVDFVKGTVTALSCGTITGIYMSGHISNETNLRTIGFREQPSIRKFTIADGCRFQLPFTVEDFTDAAASLNFNLYNRMCQELITHQEMFEDESILEYLDRDFDENNGYDSDIWNLESYTYTEIADLDPTAISPSFAGDPFEYRTNAILSAITTVIYELCDRGKLDNLGFVIYANPKCTRLLKKYVTWTVNKSTTIGGVQMNHTFGVLTDFDTPIRVVASNRIDAYTLIDAYQKGSQEGDKSREYFFKIVAYPMDKFHVTYKHLRFARYLTNSPENAAYADAQNPGGQAVLVTTSSRYETISIQGIQGRVICKNSALAPDSLAGVVTTTTMEETAPTTDNATNGGEGGQG
jgi:hypothetical protein